MLGEPNGARGTGMIAGLSTRLRAFARGRRMNAGPLRRGHDSIDIRQLISPLRYDVIVRSQFFTKLEAWRGDPLPEILVVARQEPYFVWFTSVECARFFPSLLEDPNLLIEKFNRRVTRAVATLRSFDRRGFDTRYPVTLLSTSGRQVTDSGAVVSQRFHIGDGCHRLALLLRTGQKLEPPMYRVRDARGPVLDNTAILLQRLPVTDDDYARFLSGRFASEEYSDLAALRSAVGKHSPEQLADLDQVVKSQHGALR